MTEATNEAQASDKPNFRVLTQFVRTMEFRNPADGKPLSGRPELNININVDARRTDTDGIFRVALKVEAGAKDAGADAFNVALEYAGIFQITGANDQLTQQILLIECPRMLFPFARRVVADATRDGGYPPLLLDPIDFVQLYRQQLERARAQGQGENPSVVN